MELKRRKTLQKSKIKEYLDSVYSHPTAEEIYKHVKKEIPSITLATVYRNLNILIDEGQIIKITLDKESHFDGHTENHLHLICEKCEVIEDLHNKLVFDEIGKLLNKKTDFSFKHIDLQVIGTCNHCMIKN